MVVLFGRFNLYTFRLDNIKTIGRQVMTDRNPRGLERPKDGRGGGKGVNRGRGMGRNTGDCRVGGLGKGLGNGRGAGRNRIG